MRKMFSKTFSTIVVALSLFLSENAAVPDNKVMYYDIRNLSLEPPYIDQGLRNVNWNFGNATIMEVNRYIRLTPNLPSKQGWLWSNGPLISNNWEVEFEYKIHSKGRNNGDGFAFFYTSEKGSEGDAFGNIRNFNGLGIFFDTFPNSKHGYSFPRISAMIGDGNLEYDVENDGRDSISAACSMKIRDQYHPTKVKIVYIKNNYLEVSLTNDENKKFVRCFTIQKPLLPKSGYLGFSASTGDATDNHDIISVRTRGILDKFVGKTGQRKILRSDQTIASETHKKIKASLFVIGILLTICIFVVFILKGNNYSFGDSHKHYGHFN
jgi:mannose-binding lectin 2